MQVKLFVIWLVVLLSLVNPLGGNDIKSAQGQPLSFIVTTTAYSYGEPNNSTATGKHVSTKYIALSRDLLKIIPYGAKVRVTCGKDIIEAEVQDKMGFDPKTKKPWTMRVDRFMTTKKQCKIWGIKKNCKLEKLDKEKVK